MHHLPSPQSVTRFKLTSWVLLLMWLVIPPTLGLIIYSLLCGDKQLTHLALWLLGGSVLVGIIQWLLGLRLRCPLCLAHPIAHDGCSKHRSAKHLFGSYRLRVACSIVFMNYFRCPYCGEATAVEVRQNSLRHRRRC